MRPTPDRSPPGPTSSGNVSLIRTSGSQPSTRPDDGGWSWRPPQPGPPLGARTMGMDEPIWITGIGMATPLGHDLWELDDHLLNGRSAVDAVTSFSTRDYPSRIAAQVHDIPVPAGRDRDSFRSLSRLEQVALCCVESALRGPGLGARPRDLRIGV